MEYASITSYVTNMEQYLDDVRKLLDDGIIIGRTPTGIITAVQFLCKSMLPGLHNTAKRISGCDNSNLLDMILNTNRILDFSFEKWLSKHCKYLTPDLDFSLENSSADSHIALEDDLSLLVFFISTLLKTACPRETTFHKACYRVVNEVLAHINTQHVDEFTVVVQVVTRVLTCSRQCVDFIGKSLPASVSYSSLKAGISKIVRNIENQGVFFKSNCDGVAVFDNCGEYKIGTSESTHLSSASCVSVWTNCAIMGCFDDINGQILQTIFKHSPRNWKPIATCPVDIVMFGSPHIPTIAFNSSQHPPGSRHTDIVHNFVLAECQLSLDRLASGFIDLMDQLILDDNADCTAPPPLKMCIVCPEEVYSSRCRKCKKCKQPLQWSKKSDAGKNTQFRMRSERRDMRVAYSTVVKSYDFAAQRVIDCSDAYCMDGEHAGDRVHNDGTILKQYHWVEEGKLKAAYEPYPPLMWNPNSIDNINRTIIRLVPFSCNSFHHSLC